MFANEGIDLLGDGFRGTGQSKVIDLTEQEDLVTLKGSRVDGLVMGSGLEVQVGRCKDAGDVLFPKATGFRVALKSM